MTARPRSGDPAFGPVCGCGNAKAKQAWTCQPCHSKIRGYGTVSLSAQRRVWRGITSPAPVGVFDASVRTRSLEEARRMVDGELAQLVAEQAADERRTRVGWMVSLDATDRYGRPNYEVIAA